MALKTMRDIPVLSGGDQLGGHSGEFRDDRLGFLLRAQKEHPDMCIGRFFNKPFIVVSSPALLHEMLVEKSRSFVKSLALKNILYPLTGEGLFTSDGDLWKRQRKLISPLFQPSHMARYAEGMSEGITRGLDAWRDGEVLDISREMTRITMSIVGKALFDADTFNEADGLGAAIATVIEYLSDAGGSLSFVMKLQLVTALGHLEGRLPATLEGARAKLRDALNYPLPLPTARGRRFYEAMRTLDDLVQRMIQERRSIGLSRPDLLTKLLAARDEEGTTMSDRQVRDEVLTLFFAGHETTAVAMTWAIYEISKHPTIAWRLKEEVNALGGRSPRYQDLSKLAYTLRVLKETLRLYPPAFFLDREASTDVEFAGYSIPKGAILFFSPYALHRREDLWPDPARFDPDRFTPEAEAARGRLEYLPFGAGPRVCIGMHFSLIEAQLLLAEITQRFTLATVSKQAIVPSSLRTLRPRSPIFMQARKRRDTAVEARPA